jgi:NADH-quinone oxidoreductase subunit N
VAAGARGARSRGADGDDDGAGDGDGAGGGGSAGPIGTRVRQPEVVFVAAACALATLFFGLYPSPLFNVAREAGAALVNLI